MDSLEIPVGFTPTQKTLLIIPYLACILLVIRVGVDRISVLFLLLPVLALFVREWRRRAAQAGFCQVIRFSPDGSWELESAVQRKRRGARLVHQQVYGRLLVSLTFELPNRRETFLLPMNDLEIEARRRLVLLLKRLERQRGKEDQARGGR